MPKEPSKAVNVATPLKTNGEIDWNAIKPYVLDIVHNKNAPNTARGILYILENIQVIAYSDNSLEPILF